jgi:uncharacterized protein (DUF924 family)
MAEQERLFLYRQFEHSEERAGQALAVQLIGSVGNAEWSRYAIAHKEIIDRFGHFPHRNSILTRNSSADELALLQQPAARGCDHPIRRSLPHARLAFVVRAYLQLHSLSPSSA